MILKRLEISGFKSFAKAATLEFPAPISSIVGPNGSGKSNVADSIRWVLGEQSMKTLRGKKGEDLIFAGTAEVSKMGKASVSLVFDNTKKIFPVEFDEVIISRRVYRDGVNEYLLNGSVVRLKDIFELTNIYSTVPWCASKIFSSYFRGLGWALPSTISSRRAMPTGYCMLLPLSGNP